MLFELAGLLVLTGVVLLVVGILITKQYSLRSKLLTAFLVIVLIAMGILTFLDSRNMQESLTRSANQVLAAAATQYALRLDEFNRLNMQAVETESKLPAIVNFIELRGAAPYNRQTILEILLALQSRHEELLASYAILDANGVNLIDTDNLNIGKDESEQIYYLSPKEKMEAYQSDVIFEEGKAPSIYFSSPIHNLSGRFLGVLRARFDAKVIRAIVPNSQSLVGRGSFAIVLDERKLRLVHGKRSDLQYTQAEYISETDRLLLHKHNLLPSNLVDVHVESGEWLNKLHTIDKTEPVMVSRFYGLGTDIFSAAVAYTDTAPWTIIIAQNQEVFLEPVVEQTRNAIIVAAIITIFVVLVVWVSTHFLLNPVRRLTSVVRGMGEGNRLDATAVVEADDEIGNLAKAFNSMTGNINKLIVELEDEVEGHKQTADSLRKLSQAIEQSPVSVMITDLNGAIEYVNPEFCKITGYRSEEVIGENPSILKSGHTPENQFKAMWNAITTGQSWTGELYNKKKNGDLFWESVTISPVKNRDGESTHYLAIKEDISLRKDYEERLMYQASYDNLTDLPNRSLAYDRIQQGIANAIREENHIALLYMDFDHFKNINDTLGHTAGDEFLVRMAKRLKSCTRDVDTVARLGGDEFLVMLTDIGVEAPDDPVEYKQFIADKAGEILKAVSRPFTIENMEFSVTASIGVSIFPEDGDDPHRLLKNADTAMYRSKRKGRNMVEVFTPEMSDKVLKRVELDNKLRHAIENDQLYLKYQALMDTNSFGLIGAEALLRWEDDELGDVSPEVFIPLAEESGLIMDIGKWVLEQACEDVAKWNKLEDVDDMFVALNLSSRQFRGKHISKEIEDALSRNDLTGQNLELEITERLLMKDVPDVIATLNGFKEMDIKLSIDDFGTGYSSLSYLKRFPFDVLKIDKAFVQDIGIDPDDEALCQAIIAMAHSLGLSVIAEGVETEEQFNFMRSRGAETIQGYYVAKPMTQEDFVQFISIADWAVSVNPRSASK